MSRSAARAAVRSAANPRRTSWSSEEVRGSLGVEWARPIEAYIDQKVQLIAEGGLIFVSTAKGLVTLKADSGELAWRFDTELPLGNAPTVDQASGPIHLSAAYEKGVVFFAANDNHAYAVKAADGSQVFKSTKLPGDGFHSYWPVIYRDKVIYAAAVVGGNATNAIYEVERPWPPEMEGALVGPLLAGQPRSNGYPVIRAERVLQRFEDNPTPHPYHHQPYHRPLFVLGQADGKEFTFDSDGDGHAEHIPFAWWGTGSGTRYPPIVAASDTLLYAGSTFTCCSDAKGKVYGWSIEAPDQVSLVGSRTGNNGQPMIGGGWAALAEPQAISGGGDTIYRSLCCDRVGDWFSVLSPPAQGQFWSYNLKKQLAGYDNLWSVSQKAISRHIGWYSGKLTTNNGIYRSHGDQNPIIPYGGRVYVHRSNVIIAFGPGAPKGLLPELPIQPKSDQINPPSVAELKQRLEAEVQKILSAGGHLRPGYATTLMHNYTTQFGDYFRNPGDTLRALAAAYPHLSSTLQAQVKSYLETALIPDYFSPVAYADMGWADGKPREAMPLPSQLAAELAAKGKRPWTSTPTSRPSGS